jgi:HlyD family secretion protein
MSPHRIAIVICFLSSSFIFAAEPAAEKKSEGPPTHTVKKGALKSKAQVDAVIEPRQMEAVKLAPKSWSDFTVQEVVAHGAQVKKGDVLIRFESEKLKDQLEDLEAERPGAKIAFELATAELDNLEQSTPAKLDAAKRAFRNADEDYSYFESTGRPQREKSVKFSLKGAEQRLENANEELKQLLKMYEADDVTEETEEIILKRQKYAVESSQFFLESQKLTTKRDLEVLIPREYENLKNTRRDQELALTLAEQNLPRALAKKRLDVDKMKRDQKKAEKKFADLKSDAELLTIKSPMDGTVFYGANENGKWTTGGTVSKKLIAGGKVSANEVIMTVVNAEDLLLKATIAEADLGNFKQGLKGTASPISAPNNKIPVQLDQLGYLPLPGGGFEAQISFKKEKGSHLLPGMTCKVSFSEGEKEHVLAPKDAVFGESDAKYVYLAKNSKKRTVKVGESDDKMVAITDGLSSGDQILLKKPEGAE